MKKRLLSAALALAMVLTLLPVSAFAVPTGAPADMKEGSTVTRATQTDGGRDFGEWYFQYTDTADGNKIKYFHVEEGIVATVGNSGAWYTDVAAYVTANHTTIPSQITNLSSSALNLGNIAEAQWPSGTIQIELNGANLTLPSALPAKVTGLTITNQAVYGGTNSQTVSAVARASGITSGFTLSVTNATVTSIDLTGGYTNRVELYDANVSGTIQMNGTTTVNTSTSYYGQTLILNNENGDRSAYVTELGGAVTITGDNSTVTLVNATGAQDVTVNGNSGTIRVAGISNIGDITTKTRVVESDTNKSYSPASVTVTGGTVKGIKQHTDEACTGKANVTVSNAKIGTTGIVMKKDATVSIGAGTSMATTTPVTVPQGSLTVTGTKSAPTTVGAITIGAAGVRTSLTVNGGKVTGGDIANNSGANLTLSIPKEGSPADKAYTFGALTLGDYAGGGIKGGTFDTQIKTAHDRNWMGDDVAFSVQLDSGKWTYYGSQELGQAFADLGQTKAVAHGNVILVGQNATTNKDITLYNGTTAWAKVGYDKMSVFYLPSVMFGTPVAEWMTQAGSIAEKYRFTTPLTVAEVALSYQEGGELATGIRSVSSTPAGVRAALVGNVITLSGAVEDLGSGLAGIQVTLETDIQLQDSAAYKTVTVDVVYNTKTRETYFNTANVTSALTDIGIVVSENKLSMNNGKVEYTLNGSGLGVPAPNLQVRLTSTEIQATVTKSGVTEAQKNELIAKLTGTNGVFTWSSAPAMMQAVNAAQKTITSRDSVTGWINNAQSTVWRTGYKTPGSSTYATNMTPHGGTYDPTSTDGAVIASTFSTAYLVPYLQVTVTDFASDYSTLTATLTPYYRVEISGSTYDATKAYVAQTGRTLGAITGDMAGGVTVNFNGLTTPTWAHQDSTYGYAENTGSTEPKVANSWTITHAGAREGLGTVVFNSTASLITLTHQKGAVGSDGKTDGVTASADEVLNYDTLQAAIDDTLPQVEGKEDVISVPATYQGSYSASVTGKARTFKATLGGNKPLDVSASGDLVKSSLSGKTWTVQLLKDNVTKGNITISSVTGGSASVNANPASYGQTVTITLSASSGYVPSGVTVRDASNNAVTVSGSGSTFTFTMPSGSVTVTPSFTKTSTKATVAVSANNMGNTTTTAAATNNQVDAGSSVGVTTYPGSGYRTMGVSISTNVGAVSANRVSDNYFTFTVPANATSVTVTPSYDLDNGTRFTDVWSSTYYSTPVAWAVNLGITTGQSSYLFGSNNTCTREQMVTFLYRAAGSPAVGNVRNPFWDVSPSAYYYNAVLWAVSKGITNGVSGTQFGVGQAVTRAQVVTFLYRYAGSPAASTNSGFYDVPSSAYYARAVTWAVNKGVTNGTGSYTFSPTDDCLRRDVVTFLHRDLTNTRA